MVGRVIGSSASMLLRKSHALKIILSNSSIFTPPLHRTSSRFCSLGDVMCKAFVEGSPCLGHPTRFPFEGRLWVHSAPFSTAVGEGLNPSEKGTGVDGAGADNAKLKRKKLKGKRAVVRWLKHFRWKKKKDYERMTAEEKILYKLNKARKKEERIVEALKKIEPKETSETTHDPEILTPEEHFFFLKMGIKCKNYVPVGRRGLYQGVILNMHLHWKKHQTLKVVVKTFSPEEVKEMASELARLSGGIVLDIHEENTIIMYRGKNYTQPPTEIMSPRVTLPRKKALDKSKYRDELRAVRRYIPRLEQELELLRAQAERRVENRTDTIEGTQNMDAIEGIQNAEINNVDSGGISSMKESMKEWSENDRTTDSFMGSDSEDLSDIFETDSDSEVDEKAERPLYLDQFEKFPTEHNEEPEDFKEHLHQISVDSRNSKSFGKDEDTPNFDEVDKLFLRAANLLKKQRR
ncbi:hypothetical protein Ddye_016664 [Dipteronia dyeriana]|uniref:CRM domain-containing protein n=1 Tax=Dipteronia dyeriana TaxID=168575 RepID=A0AAD9U758_9ROSI|nr:hypothetical protein Ddye_016664 [Dipteronia dyeriana]